MNMCCPRCPGKTYDASEVFCPEHQDFLEPCAVEETQFAPDQQPVPPPEPTQVDEGRSWSAAVCWSCDAAAPPTANTQCLACGARLVPPRLVLTVTSESLTIGSLALDRGESAALGREGPHAGLFASFPNVSRLHATVGVDPDGAVWIQPLPTPNGTFHGPDEREVPPGERQALGPDDTVRLALDARISVALYAPPGT